MVADGALVVMTACVIDEDRRSANGRYIVMRLHDGRFQTNWADEAKIKAAFARAGITLPAATTFKEKSLWLAEYGPWFTDSLLIGVAALAAIALGWRFLRRR